MNWHYVVIIIAVFVLFISMGSNPFEAPDGYVPPDEFKDGIKAKINNNQGFGGTFSPGTGAPTNFGSFGGSNAGGGMINQNSGGMNSMGAAPGISSFGGQPAGNAANAPYGTMAPGGNPLAVSPVTEPFKQAPASSQPQLPAPFQNLPQTGGQGAGASGSSYMFPNAPAIKTTSGSPVTFAGSTVYTINNQGKAVLMKDGVHYLADGRMITVKNGRNMFPANGNQFN